MIYLELDEVLAIACDVLGLEVDASHSLWRACDVRLPPHRRAVVELRAKRDALVRRGKNAPAYGQDLACRPHRFAEVSGHAGKSSQEEIAKVMPSQVSRAFESILKKRRQERFVGGESHETVANVAGRQHLKLVAQTSGATAVIRDRDERGEVGEIDIVLGGFRRRVHELLEPGEKGGQTGASANGEDPQAVNHETAALQLLRVGE